jgi:hypothetical protein
LNPASTSARPEARPDLSVLIPVYNRGDLIRYTLESVRRASAGLAVETIIVDDGSTTPAAESIAQLGYESAKIIRQANQGLLFARLRALREAAGRCTLFLDSDDLVSPEKFRAQLAAMDQSGAEVSYTDSARATLEGDYDQLTIATDAPAARTTEGADFFINVQPAPHSPIFRTDFLRDVVARAFFPPSPLYNSVAEIWFYHNAAPRPARVVHVPGPHTIIGRHPGARLTNHWEKLGAASLAVMEAFARSCPRTPDTTVARRYVGETAFRSWRRLPRDFSPEFSARLLGVWRTLAPGNSPALGGRQFQLVARIVGAERAGRLFKRLQNGPYSGCRTMSDADFSTLLRTLPPA